MDGSEYSSGPQHECLHLPTPSLPFLVCVCHLGPGQDQHEAQCTVHPHVRLEREGVREREGEEERREGKGREGGKWGARRGERGSQGRSQEVRDRIQQIYRGPPFLEDASLELPFLPGWLQRIRTNPTFSRHSLLEPHHLSP